MQLQQLQQQLQQQLPQGAKNKEDMIHEIKRLRERIRGLESDNAALHLKMSRAQKDVDQVLLLTSDFNLYSRNPRATTVVSHELDLYSYRDDV